MSGSIGKEVWVAAEVGKNVGVGEGCGVCVLCGRKCAKSGERRSTADDVMWFAAVAEKNAVEA